MRRRRLAPVLAIVLAALLAVSGCTAGGAGPRPGVPDNEVQALAAALTAGKLSQIPFVNSTGVQADFEAALGTMGTTPKVVPGNITVTTESNTYIATADLTVTWALPGGDWTYTTTAVLEHDSDWRTRWAPSMVYPQLTSTTRLVRTQKLGDRAAVLDRDGQVLAGLQDGYRIGLDKTLIPSTSWESSARVLAKVLNIDPDAYAKKVAGYTAKAWVPAASVAGNYAPPAVYDVPGATATRTTVYTGAAGRSSTFAQPLLGITGEASAEVVKASNGAVVAGDIVGVSGLQLLYDAQLRGTPAVTITLADRPAATTAPSSSASASPSAATTPSGSDTASGSASPSSSTTVLLDRKAVAGTPLKLTISSAAQAQAEKVLVGKKQAALVATNPSTGQILAVATSTDASMSIATQGRSAPGSTFKVVTSLALLRKGFTADSVVSCQPTTTVNGRTLKNYSDYPSSKLGRIPLRTAFAESCNTAFVSNYNKLGADSLADAAGSLGVGVDYEPGYYSFWGSVPSVSDPVARAESMIGQGQVQVSAVAMAAVASSVAAGKTVIPSLISGKTITPKGKPLTTAEASTLQSLMVGVVNSGSGTSLKGVVTGAKSGTAEYSSNGTIKTHAWMIGFKSNTLAVSVFVEDGASGTRTAGPILSGFVKGI